MDVFLTRTDRDGLTSNLIMQNVKVIAVDQFADQDANRARLARTATVEVSPEDAQKLALAQQIGRISLGLRQIDENDVTEDARPVDIKDLLNEEEIEPAPAAPARRLCVRKGIDLICE